MNLTLGERIQIYRKRKNLNFTQLGKKVFKDVVNPHIKMRKVEADFQKPTEAELKKIAKILNVSMEKLVNGNNFIDYFYEVFHDVEKDKTELWDELAQQALTEKHGVFYKKMLINELVNFLQDELEKNNGKTESAPIPVSNSKKYPRAKK